MKKEDPRVLLGKGIRALREARHLTQSQLAERADLESWKYIGTVENARTNIGLTNLMKLANGLGITVAEMMASCFPKDQERRDLLNDLLKLVADEDPKTIRLVTNILDEVKRWAAAD